MPFSNLWANRVFAPVDPRCFNGISTHDVTTGMFGFRRQAGTSSPGRPIPLFPPRSSFARTWRACAYKEVPISYQLRLGEVTLHRWRSGKAYLRCFLKYRFGLKTPAEKL